VANVMPLMSKDAPVANGDYTRPKMAESHPAVPAQNARRGNYRLQILAHDACAPHLEDYRFQ
jgi:hypothetical protein